MTLANVTDQERSPFKERHVEPCESEDLYCLALALSGHTVLVLDIPNKTLNQICHKLDRVNIESSVVNAPESIIVGGYIYPDDIEAYREFYESIYTGIPAGECTLRFLEEGHGWTWFTMRYQTVYAEDGSPSKAVILFCDSTDEKRAELIYEEYYSSVTRDAIFVWEVNLDRDILLKADDITKEAFLKNDSEKYSDIAEKVFKFVPEKYRDRVKETFSIANLRQEFKRAQREIVLSYPTQTAEESALMWVQATAHLIQTAKGNLNAIMCICNITDRKLEEERLRQESEQDDLSGLYNRQAFEQRVNDLLKKDRRTKGGHLYIIDIDNLKVVNENHGHIVGDEILQCLADTLRKCFRNNDIIGRVAGDEFMAFVRNIDSVQAVERAIEIEKHFVEMCSLRDIDYSVTLSQGIAEAGEYDGFASLHNKAERALSRSKQNGRGCWTVWGE